MRNSCTETEVFSPSSQIKIGAAALKLRCMGAAVYTGSGVAAGSGRTSGGGVVLCKSVAAGLVSGRAAKGAARASRPNTTARRNVFFKGRALLAICGAGRYNRNIPRGLSYIYAAAAPCMK